MARVYIHVSGSKRVEREREVGGRMALTIAFHAFSRSFPFSTAGDHLPTCSYFTRNSLCDVVTRVECVRKPVYRIEHTLYAASIEENIWIFLERLTRRSVRTSHRGQHWRLWRAACDAISWMIPDDPPCHHPVNSFNGPLKCFLCKIFDRSIVCITDFGCKSCIVFKKQDNK